MKRISISIEYMSSRCEDGLPGVKMSLRGDSLFEGGCWNLRSNKCPTLARHRDGLGFIRIWATPKKLVFWDGAPSSYKIVNDISPIK